MSSHLEHAKKGSDKIGRFLELIDAVVESKIFFNRVVKYVYIF